MNEFNDNEKMTSKHRSAVKSNSENMPASKSAVKSYKKGIEPTTEYKSYSGGNKKLSKKNKKKMTTKNKVIMTVLIVIITLSVLSVTCVALLNSSLFKKKTAEQGDDIDNSLKTADTIKDKNMNILVVGVDALASQKGYRAGTLTDVIMLVNYDIENGKINIVNIPRDTYIGDDYKTGKINAIYESKDNGGIQGLAARINKMFKVSIDHYVMLDLDGVIDIVDAIGGIDMDVPKSFNLDGVQINKGMQHLDGAQAEKIVRERHAYGTADLGRIETQHIFLKACMTKVFSMSKTQAISLAPSIMGKLNTDFTLGQLLGLYTKVMDGAKDNIKFHTLPVVGGAKNGQSYISIKGKPTADMLNQYFRPHSDKVSAEDLEIIELVTNYPYDPNDPNL